jgi:hypothetical protein
MKLDSNNNGSQRKNGQGSSNRIRDHRLRRDFKEQLLQDLSPGTDSVKKNEQAKSIRPYMVIGCGTTGVKIADRIKRNCSKGSEPNCVQFLAIDTDPSARAGTILTDNEFYHLKLQRIQNALENPDKHPKIWDRIEGDHPDNRAMLESFVADPLEQASAVRMHGLHGLMAESTHVQAIIQEKLQQINDLSGGLDRQLNVGSSTRIREDIKVFIISSICGGSGSSANLQIIAQLKQMTMGMKLEIVPIFVMPSAFEDTLKKLPEHWMRTRANGYATLLEFAAFMKGLGTTHDIDLGADDQESLQLLAGFVRGVFIVGNKNCKGKHLSKEVILSTIVEFIGAIICKPNMADVIETFDANNATLNLTEDDDKARYVNSFAAGSACLDSDRIARYCAPIAMRHMIRSQAIGEETGQSQDKVESVLINPAPKIPSLKDNSLPESIVRNVSVSFEAKSRCLSRGKNGAQTQRLNDADFVSAASSLHTQISKEWIPKARGDASEIGKTLQSRLESSFDEALRNVVASSGLRAGVVFLEAMEKRLLGIHGNHQKKLETLRKNASQLESAINNLLDKMGRKWLRRWTKSKVPQDQVVKSMKSLYEAEVNCLAYVACSDLLHQLRTWCNSRLEEINKALSSSEDLLQDLKDLQLANTAGNRSHTDFSNVEIDIGSRQMDDLLFKRLCPDLRTQVQNIPVEDRFRWFLQLCTKGELSDKVRSEFEAFFSKKISKLSFPEIMCEVLENEESAGDLRTKLLHVVQETQPAWGEADSKRNSTMFADHLIIGIPDGPESKRMIVEEEIRRAAKGRVSVNSQYNPTLQILVVPGNKLTVIRLVQGAAWHYLPEVRNLELAYNKWYQDGGHTVHIFNRATVAKMPSLIPAKRLLDEEQAIAVGLAYGAIARRGQQYYWNLRKENQTYCFPLKSHWDTIATEPNSSLSRLAKDGKYITFSGEECLEESLKIGTSLASLQAHLKTNAAHRKLMLEFFSSLREQSGDSVIASELDEFVSKLLSRDSKLNTTSADAHSLTTLVGRVIDMLRLVK